MIELGFRQREDEIRSLISQPMTATEVIAAVTSSTHKSPDDHIKNIRKLGEAIKDSFQNCIDELNARFSQNNYPLNYHNGFIQLLTDNLVQQKIENPFWMLVRSPKWTNLELDMKEALDLRDSNGRDPTFYAARALESTIKIVSQDKNWTRGNEKGVHNYIDNLGAKTNAFVTYWECYILKEFFTNVRNPFGHGPGSDVMPSLSQPQTEWAIEFSMIWIKNLIRRL